MEFIILPKMAQNTKVNGDTINELVKASTSFKMEDIMMGHGLRVKDKVRESNL